MSSRDGSHDLRAGRMRRTTEPATPGARPDPADGERLVRQPRPDASGHDRRHEQRERADEKPVRRAELVAGGQDQEEDRAEAGHAVDQRQPQRGVDRGERGQQGEPARVEAAGAGSIRARAATAPSVTARAGASGVSPRPRNGHRKRSRPAIETTAIIECPPSGRSGAGAGGGVAAASGRGASTSRRAVAQLDRSIGQFGRQLRVVSGEDDGRAALRERADGAARERRAAASMPRVGSSRSTSAGEPASVAASAARCRSPELRSRG
jgi:hypothetical protein